MGGGGEGGGRRERGWGLLHGRGSGVEGGGCGGVGDVKEREIIIKTNAIFIFI